MMTFIMFWLAKGIASLLWVALLFVVIVVVSLGCLAWAWLRAAMCRHEYVTRHRFPHVRCEALKETVCVKCGKVKNDR